MIIRKFNNTIESVIDEVDRKTNLHWVPFPINKWTLSGRYLTVGVSIDNHWDGYVIITDKIGGGGDELRFNIVVEDQKLFEKAKLLLSGHYFETLEAAEKDFEIRD